MERMSRSGHSSGRAKHQRPLSPRSRLGGQTFPASLCLITKPATCREKGRCLGSASNQSLETRPPSSQTGSHRANGQIEQHGNLRIPHAITQTQLYSLALMARQPLEVRSRRVPHGIPWGPMCRLAIQLGRTLTAANRPNVSLNN